MDGRRRVEPGHHPGAAPAGLGGRADGAFVGRTFTYRYDVVAGDGQREIELRVENPFPMRVRYLLEEVAEGTRASIHATGDAGGFSGSRARSSTSWSGDRSAVT